LAGTVYQKYWAPGEIPGPFSFGFGWQHNLDGFYQAALQTNIGRLKSIDFG
jgi:hypothetical protein